jgi:rare lipoprotein A
LGQHSHNPSPHDRKPSPGKRRWTAIAAGAAVVAAASTTAWAAVGDDSPKPAAAHSHTPNPPAAAKAAQQTKLPEPTPKTTSPNTTPAPRPPAAARPAKTPAATRTPEVVKEVKTAKPKTRVLSSGTCGASYYGEPQMTASGERFNPSALTAAHKSLPLGSKVRVTNPGSGESVTVRINDRGPYVGGRCLDPSQAAFAAIGSLNSGVMRVKYEVLAR